MKLVFYRGSVPTDRDPHEIMFNTLEESDDVWEHLASTLADEQCDIVYTGGKREVKYTPTTRVIWVKDVDRYNAPFTPDVVMCRGGFPEGDRMADKFPEAIKVFYGAGQRYYPKGKTKYDIILTDSLRQYQKVISKGMNAVTWVKPCSPCFRVMPEIRKEFDVCFVADGRFPFRAKIKNVKWAYKTLPPTMKMLHLGWSGKYDPSKNITVKRVLRSEMPEMYNRCKVGVVPYTSYDSAPRVIPEMLACGLPVVCLDSVHTSNRVNFIATKDTFWDTVRTILAEAEHTKYGSVYTVQDAAKNLRGVIDSLREWRAADSWVDKTKEIKPDESYIQSINAERVQDGQTRNPLEEALYGKR